ncbi:hypothetical protein [Macellibacteroides fermentans]|uniref:hypothetical protein n=1 Tax=Macellibacteroides fermentans TaxID=879969 RepID=UPI00406D2249
MNGTNGYFSGAVVAKYQSSTYVEDFPIAGTNVYGTIKYDGTTIGINANGQLTIVGGAGVSS